MLETKGSGGLQDMGRSWGCEAKRDLMGWSIMYRKSFTVCNLVTGCANVKVLSFAACSLERH